ncbi:MAG: hypothetical protein V1679_00120 [Candidatus Peregrinibacteria bacterium]
MNLQLSWDLFIVVFFIVIVAYSLIIGRDNTIKVILGTYVALVCADAIGGLFANYFGGTMMFLQFAKEANMESVDEAVIFTKVIIFLLMVILFAVRGAFMVGTARTGGVVGMVVHLFYALCSAGLIVSAVLVLISGVSLLGGGGVVSEALSNLTKQSYLALNLVFYANFFFAIPAAAFLLNSFQGGDE